MALTYKKPFQLDRPVFVRLPFRAAGHSYKKGDVLPWKERSMKAQVIERLYVQGYLIHDEEKEVSASVGDGLEALNIDSLHTLVETINEKVKAKTNSQTDFNKKKCKLSKIPDKQRGLIRSWRRVFGRLEED